MSNELPTTPGSRIRARVGAATERSLLVLVPWHGADDTDGPEDPAVWVQVDPPSDITREVAAAWISDAIVDHIAPEPLLNVKGD